jgi:hypothetical protein
MGAKAWELHATLALARLGGTEDDREMLRELARSLPEPPSAADDAKLKAVLGSDWSRR